MASTQSSTSISSSRTKPRTTKYLGEMKTRSQDQNVKNVLIMIDSEGFLGDPDDAQVE